VSRRALNGLCLHVLWWWWWWWVLGILGSIYCWARWCGFGEVCRKAAGFFNDEAIVEGGDRSAWIPTFQG
jgi:hypothetical protein